MNTNGSDDADEESQSGSAPFSVTLNEPSDEDTFTSVYPMNDPPGGWMSGCFTTGLGVEVTLGGTGVVGAGVGTAVVSGAAVVGLPITGSTHPPLSTNPPGATNPSIQVQIRLPSMLSLFGGHSSQLALPSVDLKVPASHLMQSPGVPVKPLAQGPDAARQSFAESLPAADSGFPVGQV